MEWKRIAFDVSVREPLARLNSGDTLVLGLGRSISSRMVLPWSTTVPGSTPDRRALR